MVDHGIVLVAALKSRRYLCYPFLLAPRAAISFTTTRMDHRLLVVAALALVTLFFVWNDEEVLSIGGPLRSASQSTKNVTLASNEDSSQSKATSQSTLWPTGTTPVEEHADSSTTTATTTTSIDVHTLWSRFQDAKAHLVAQLTENYGPDTYADLFVDNENHRFRTAFAGSLPQLQRRIALRVLQQQPLVWATGGHSSAAGHGNYWTESYTAVLERLAQPLFRAVQSDVVGRNHAMGATGSWPEIASCLESVMGKDADVISWDYGMIDGRNPFGMAYYCYRAGMSRAACVGMHASGRGHLQALEELRERGMAALYYNQTLVDESYRRIPDTAGRSQEEIDAMPSHVRYFKCGAGLETGDPDCGTFKYNDTYCPKRKFKAKWHPGWKAQAMDGTYMALLLVQLLEDVLSDWNDEASPWNVAERIRELQASEEADYQRFLESDLPSMAIELTAMMEANETALGLDYETLYRKPSLCHTARLPSEIRHLGILTESALQTGIWDYEQGVDEATAGALEGDRMPLAMDPASRQDCPNVTLEMDYKDYFYVQHDRPRRLVLPNPAEQRYYSERPSMGLVAACVVGCGRRCLPTDLQANNLLEGSNIAINGRAVKRLSAWSGCLWLGHEEGYRFEADDDGQWEIFVNITAPDAFLRVSTWLVW